MAEHPDELTCDMVETYGVFNFMQLPPVTVATLVIGLGDDSRIKRKISGYKFSTKEILLAIACDRLGTLIWFQTKDGQKGRNRPPSIFDAMLNDEPQDKVMAFSTPAEFEEAWARAMS